MSNKFSGFPNQNMGDLIKTREGEVKNQSNIGETDVNLAPKEQAEQVQTVKTFEQGPESPNIDLNTEKSSDTKVGLSYAEIMRDTVEDKGQVTPTNDNPWAEALEAKGPIGLNIQER